MNKIQVHQGERFNDWVVIHEVESLGKERLFLCRCICGLTKSVYLTHLRSGQSVGCGCRKNKEAKIRATKHGACESPEYISWKSMRWRCNKKSKNKDYYGRGITVCKRWNLFDNFINDMGKKPNVTDEIDRKNNNKGYYPENCKWSTIKQNLRNKSNNFIITINGKEKCLAQLCEEYNVKYNMIYYRMKKLGMSFLDSVKEVQ